MCFGSLVELPEAVTPQRVQSLITEVMFAVSINYKVS